MCGTSKATKTIPMVMGDGSKIWDYNLAKREAGLDGKRKIGSSKKKSSNKKAKKK